MIEGGREILGLSTTTREYFFFSGGGDDDCFFGKGENDRVRLRGLIYLCVRGGIAICLHSRTH